MVNVEAWSFQSDSTIIPGILASKNDVNANAFYNKVPVGAM